MVRRLTATSVQVCEYAALNAALHNIEKKKKKIFNQAYREGCVPTEWGQARSISKMVTSSDARTTEGSPL